MKLKTNKNIKNPLRLAGVLVVTLILLSASYLVIAKYMTLWPFSEQSTPDTSSNSDPNSLDPTYSTNKLAPGDKNVTDTNSDPQDSSTTTGAERKETVDVAIAYADKSSDSKVFEVRAFISGVIEGGGTCTAILVKNGETLRQSSQAFIDATTSQCNPIEFPLSSIDQGQWLLTVEYNSPTSNGVSQAMKVTI